MNPQEHVSKLQGLLQRIQKNASRPRASAPMASAPVAAAPVTAAPLAFAPPAVAPQPVPSPPPPEASPMPVDVDVSFESAPPAAEVTASPSQAPDAEPIPLVAATPYQAPPPPRPVDDLSLESEVSEVRVTTAMREPAVEVTVAAIEAEAEPLGTEELSEDDLVEVTEGTPLPAGTDVDIDFDDEEEQPPASSQRSRVASSMDEALATAAQLESEREVPIKTPPPESGPQEAPMPTGFAAPAAPDVDALLGGELDIPTHGQAAPAVPTAEQLGQTIDLEEARGPALELAEQAKEAPAVVPVEELEVALPGRELAGGYDESLQPPPEALNDLEAHRRRLEDDDIPPPPESFAKLPSVQPGMPAVEIVPIAPAVEITPLAAAAPEQPEVIARAAPSGSPEIFGSVRETYRPSSFAELLDASLSLSGE